MKKTQAYFLFILAGVFLFFLKAHYVNSKLSKTPSAPLTTYIFQWSMTPQIIKNLNSPILFQFQIYDEKKRPLDVSSIHLQASMPHPGMVPIEGILFQKKPGVYESTLKITMFGDWFITLTINLKNGETIKKVLTFKTINEH